MENVTTTPLFIHFCMLYQLKMTICWWFNEGKTSAPWRYLAQGVRGMRPSAGFPGNRWAHLLSTPPLTGSLPIPPREKHAATAAAAFCLPSAIYSGMSLQDHFASDVKDLPFIKPWMSLSLTPGSFLSPEAEQVQGLQAWEVRPNTFCRAVCWPDLMIHL